MKTKEKKRIILLADMNSFYASVEQAINPALKGQPIIVCGDPARRHGIVLAASYEAKVNGVKTAMTVGEAHRLCPEAHLVPPRMKTYIEVSTRIVEIMKEFSPLVEPFSIDEAFAEITGCEQLFGDGENTAKLMQKRISQEEGIPCSIGVGPNKLLAKMAAGFQKPWGLTVLTSDDVPKRIWPLPIKKLFGVGGRMEQHFQRMAIRTIGDLADTDPELLARRFGVIGRVLHQSANGIDYSPVDPHTLDGCKSIGHQFTLSRDYVTESEIKVVLRELAEEVGTRARRAKRVGRTVSLLLKDADFRSVYRSLTIPDPSNIGRDIFHASVQLMSEHWDREPVRLVGITLSNLVPDDAVQLDLFKAKDKEYQLAEAIDGIRDRFGTQSIFLAQSLSEASVFTDRAGKIGGHIQ
ncbi:DNA polymerase-4 [Marininema mesophilum]|uniref:DNA polymerase IV n=1 Tax=Marininema mesophilum TaxID=1048340 RepID=A0A1H2SI76_9BACL|nr:DNA polymerase IV [Marininema mesophilum]SDW31403.1 DNA polymerase-4 [Marininema mesophilum]